MPILNADRVQNVIVVKRGKGAGCSGIENAPSCKDNCRMPHRSAQQAIAEVITHAKAPEV
ncbi:MAG: NAD(P)(+) transhydrogenase (Re/Si-specific) subunit beta [Pseudomonas sagittaria]|nr:NAD(P)(+) transhydrogenase (Re/Si-specific) subunit beta [Pseudomonas sagittaria]